MVEEDKEPSDPSLFEERFVHSVYDKIAPHFAHTRHSVWPQVQKFINGLSHGLTLDAGCGNGKNMPRSAGAIGLEISDQLVKLCRNKGLQVVQADGLALPFRDETFVCPLSRRLFTFDL